MGVDAQCNSSLQKKLVQEYHLNDSLLCIWRADTNGCGSARSLIVDSLIKEQVLIGMPEKNFILLFGKPDYNSGDGVLSYGVGLKCDAEKKVLEDAPGLELVLIVKEDRIFSFGYSVIN